MMTSLAILSFLIWCWLLTMRGQFWRAGPVLPVAVPSHTPPVAVVVPARNEAPLIDRTIRSLLAQNYPGAFQVTLVDDRSDDGTGAIARGIAPGNAEGNDNQRLQVIAGAARPVGWAGKLWALQQGVAASGAPEYFFSHRRRYRA